MKTVYNLLFTIILIGSIGLIGCNGERNEQIVEEQITYGERINELIATIDEEINELSGSFAEATEDERNEIAERIVALEKVRTELIDYRNRLAGDVSDEWENLKEEIEKAMEYAEDTLHDLVAIL